MRVKCSQCGRKVPSDMAICPHCETRLSVSIDGHTDVDMLELEPYRSSPDARIKAYGRVTGVALMTSISMIGIIVWAIAGPFLTFVYLAVVMAGGLCAILGRLPKLQVLSVALVLIGGSFFSLLLVPMVLVSRLAVNSWGAGLSSVERRPHLLMLLSLVGLVAQAITLFWFLSSPMVVP